MKRHSCPSLPPTNPAELRAIGWQEYDVLLVTGDAYIDHPSFGIAIIARLLESLDLRVAILSQPWHQDARDFKAMGKPRLFCGITSGNMDSIVSNYSSNARIRNKDAYSPEGNPYFEEEKSRSLRRRPDRAVIRYAQLAREAFGDTMIILGGIEASLRRFAHYDYQQERIRSSVLTDSKADLLVYGMGERAVTEIAERLLQQKDLKGIVGTCEPLTEREAQGLIIATAVNILPSLEEIEQDPTRFLTAELIIDKHARSSDKTILLQRQRAMWVKQNPAAEPLTTDELDAIYELPFTGLPSSMAKKAPAFSMIQNSITIVRGCSGNCSFCAIARHQGPVVTSRSIDSVIKEAKRLAHTPGFDGVITDMGGPTANLYGAQCKKAYICSRKDCLYPKPCPNLSLNETRHIELLKKTAKLSGIRRVFVSSGLRMELLLETPKLMEAILLHHTPGNLKIAPEHTEDEVLRLMHKPGARCLEPFLKETRSMAKTHKRQLNINPYFIASHPGCTLYHMNAMAKRIKELRLIVRQFQDFTPTPGTISTAMFVSERNRDAPERHIYVARRRSERTAQRKVLEHDMAN
ncbi:MAG: YgiQ family radical SAM protein [Dissulfuribacterales bacterium]